MYDVVNVHVYKHPLKVSSYNHELLLLLSIQVDSVGRKFQGGGIYTLLLMHAENATDNKVSMGL